MIVNALKQCCYLCHYPAIEVESNGNPAIRIDAYIYCEHDKVCKHYNESEENKDGMNRGEEA
jgi:hypothetical protein